MIPTGAKSMLHPEADRGGILRLGHFMIALSVCSMTHLLGASSPADAEHIYVEWDRRIRAHDIDGLVELYLPDVTLESPLVPRILDQVRGVLRGHDELRSFFVKGTAGRPN